MAVILCAHRKKMAINYKNGKKRSYSLQGSGNDSGMPPMSSAVWNRMYTSDSCTYDQYRQLLLEMEKSHGSLKNPYPYFQGQTLQMLSLRLGFVIFSI